MKRPCPCDCTLVYRNVSALYSSPVRDVESGAVGVVAWIAPEDRGVVSGAAGAVGEARGES